MLSDIDWYAVRCKAFTEIRREFSVRLLEEMESKEENDTPVCGDTLRNGFAKVQNAE